MLIAFTGYLQSAQFDPGSPDHVKFPDWMVHRAELRRWGEEVWKICISDQ